MNTLKNKLTVILSGIALLSGAQEASNKYMRPETPAAIPYLSNFPINEARQPLYLPEIEGYTLLKCDFHLHTVFSDGNVWPTTRVEEAFREGLDAIAITEHFEHRYIHRKELDTDNLMREYEIAKPLADQYGILLVPGLEITREVPTGHFCVLFLTDPSPLLKYINKEKPYDPSNIEATLAEAKKLGGYTTWNHPGYQKPNGAEWDDIHQSLYSKKLFQGIEIINSNMYIPLVFQWAQEKELTVMANTDMHGNFRNRDKFYRAMTLVFAKERSVEAIKEALFNRQTVGYAYNHLYGEERWLKPIFENSIKTRVLSMTDKQVMVEIRNLSGVPFELEFPDNENTESHRVTNREFVLYGNETIGVSLKRKTDAPLHALPVTVKNLHTSHNTPLRSEIKLK